MEEQPRTGTEFRAIFAKRFPGISPAALAHACQIRLAFVQVPPRGLWGRSAQVRSTTAESWLGRPFVADPSIDAVVLRYLAAFGPASVADVTTWCRLTGLREVVERPDRNSARSETSAVASSSISRTHRAPPRTLQPPFASCPSTTTSCSATTSAAGSAHRN
jgi:hypothetical protein